MATITGDMVINEVIKKHPSTMEVFNNFEMDIGCGGEHSIAVTSKTNGVDVEVLVKALNVAVQVAEGECGYCGDPEDKKT